MRGVSRVCKHVRVTAALSRQGGTNCLPPTTPVMPLESCQSWFSVGATISDRRVQFTGTAVLWVSDVLFCQAPMYCLQTAQGSLISS